MSGQSPNLVSRSISDHAMNTASIAIHKLELLGLALRLGEQLFWELVAGCPKKLRIPGKVGSH